MPPTKPPSMYSWALALAPKTRPIPSTKAVPSAPCTPPGRSVPCLHVRGRQTQGTEVLHRTLLRQVGEHARPRDDRNLRRVPRGEPRPDHRDEVTRRRVFDLDPCLLGEGIGHFQECSFL